MRRMSKRLRTRIRMNVCSTRLKENKKMVRDEKIKVKKLEQFPVFSLKGPTSVTLTRTALAVV